MKTKIITLETHDNLISVRDKLSWAKTPRILLVWPKYEDVTLRLLDLKVLQRHADSLGAQMGLVTRRLNVKRDAESLNIPVFDSTASAQKDLWHVPAPRTQRIPKPPKHSLRKMRDEVLIKEPVWRTSLFGRVITFTIGVIAVLVLAGIFVPRAAVTLYPESQTISVVIPVHASPSFNSVSFTGNVPAQIISVTIDVEQTKTITSQITIPTSNAKGFVQFQNLSSDEISIPAGTVIATETLIRFETLNRSLLPAGSDAIVEIPIQALTSGSEGNVEADEIISIEGPLGLLMTVTNPESTTGGADINAVGASEADRTQLREQVLEELKLTAETQIRSRMNEKDFLLLDSMEMTEILTEEFSPPETEAGSTLTLKMQAEFTARYILASDIQAITLSSLNASIPNGFTSFGEIDFDLFDTPVTDSADVTHFQLQASQVVLKEVDVLQIFSLIRGNNLQNAKTELTSAFSARQGPQINITPSWWKWLPLIPFNISVEVK